MVCTEVSRKINIIKKITTKAIKKLQSIFERVERLLDRKKRRDIMQGVLKGQLTAGQLPPVFILFFFFCLDNNLDLCRGGFVFVQ